MSGQAADLTMESNGMTLAQALDILFEANFGVHGPDANAMLADIGGGGSMEPMKIVEEISNAEAATAADCAAKINELIGAMSNAGMMADSNGSEK